MDPNKVEVNETFIAEWLENECLWNVKARAYKYRNARVNALRALAELFEIIRNSQSFTQTVPRFLFRSVFSFLELLQWQLL